MLLAQRKNKSLNSRIKNRGQVENFIKISEENGLNEEEFNVINYRIRVLN